MRYCCIDDFPAQIPGACQHLFCVFGFVSLTAADSDQHLESFLALEVEIEISDIDQRTANLVEVYQTFFK